MAEGAYKSSKATPPPSLPQHFPSPSLPLAGRRAHRSEELLQSIALSLSSVAGGRRRPRNRREAPPPPPPVGHKYFVTNLLFFNNTIYNKVGESVDLRKKEKKEMAAFSGTQDKCKACDKTVHFIDLLTADGIPYHKTCFKCTHCKGNLTMCSYSSMDGVLYCKPHFEQLFKETGSFSKNFQTYSSFGKSGNSELTRTPSKVSSMFSGTQDKCATCKKTAYPLEKLTVEGESYHKTCFKCSHGGCVLTTSSYAALDGVLYCKIHFAQLFKEKGDYNHVLKKTASIKKTTNAASTADEDHPQQSPQETEATVTSAPEST